MRRLSIQLALAMLGTMVLTLLVIAGTQRWAEWRRFYDLPEEVRARVPHPRPFLPDGVTGLFYPQRPAPLPPGGEHGSPYPGAVEEQGSYNDRLALSYRAFNRFQNEAFVVGVALAAAMSLALALWLSRLVARPIERVSRATTRLAGGDLSVRVPTPKTRRLNTFETEQLTENFNSMAASLESYETERKAMIADIAHELRTPLTALTLRLQALQDGLVPLDASEVGSLNRNAALLSRLVEDLRILSLADAGRLQLKRQAVDLGTLVADVFDDYQSRLTAQKVRGELLLPSGQALGNVDPDRMTQVIGNLLDNALRVSPEGGTVTVTLERQGAEYLIRVRDTGPGLSEEAAERAFDRYFQEKDVNYSAPPAGASGLGLAIVRTLVELHGGSVTVTNVADPTGADPTGADPTGAMFTVRLPVEAGA